MTSSPEDTDDEVALADTSLFIAVEQIDRSRPARPSASPYPSSRWVSCASES